MTAHELHHLFIWNQTAKGADTWRYKKTFHSYQHKNQIYHLYVSESRWLIESSAQFFAGAYEHSRNYRYGYMYTTVNPHLALWQHYAYEVIMRKHEMKRNDFI